MPYSVGVDLVGRDEVEQAMATHGDRYLQRVYSEEEQADAGRRALALAARFAAKEATMKALGAVRVDLPWRSISVHCDAGRPSLRLRGAAADTARRARVTRLELAFVYRKQVAAAIVLAELEA